MTIQAHILTISISILLQWWCTRIRKRTRTTTRTTGRESWRRSPLTTIITSTAKCSYRWVAPVSGTRSHYVETAHYLRSHLDAPNFKKMHIGRLGARARSCLSRRRATPAPFAARSIVRSIRLTVAKKSIFAERDLVVEPRARKKKKNKNRQTSVTRAARSVFNRFAFAVTTVDRRSVMNKARVSAWQSAIKMSLL